MRLSKLKIKGYRSIKKDETLIADDRVTILIGANDHGKSNLLAAIGCLNDEDQISVDDRNWDLNSADPVEIVWHFTPDAEEIERLKELGPKPIEKPATASAQTDENPGAASTGAPIVPTPPTPSDSPIAPNAIVVATAPEIKPAQVTKAVEAAASQVTARVAPPEPKNPGIAAMLAPSASAPIVVSPPEPVGSIFPISNNNEIVFSRDLATNKVKVVELSQRTKSALAAAKARGVKLGNPRPLDALHLARAVHISRRPAPEVVNIMRSLEGQGMSYRAIARELNQLNIRTGRGCEWFGATVKAALQQFAGRSIKVILRSHRGTI